MKEACSIQDIYFMNDSRRQLLREQPSHVIVDDQGRRISLLLEQHGLLHLAFAMIEKEDAPPAEMAASGNSQKDAIRALDHTFVPLVQIAEQGAMVGGRK